MAAVPRLRVLISAGPTREPVDPVRFLSNYSTGYMGACLAAEALRRGHRVTVVRGPCEEPFPRGARLIPVERTDEMARAMRQLAPRADVLIMAAAVADFRPTRVIDRKVPRRSRLTLALEATPDILAGLPNRKRQVRIGFALEARDAIAGGWRKLVAKRLDAVLAQAGGNTPPFGRRRVRAYLLARDGTSAELGDSSKPRIARAILDKAEALWYGQCAPQGSPRRAGRARSSRRVRVLAA